MAVLREKVGAGTDVVGGGWRRGTVGGTGLSSGAAGWASGGVGDGGWAGEGARLVVGFHNVV